MEKKYVWLVRQTQPSSDYYQYTFAVFDNEKYAVKLARLLNKQYGKGCIFNDVGDFIEVDWENAGDDCYHYYDVSCQRVNPDPNIWEA